MSRNHPTSVVPFDVKLMNITATVMFMGCLAALVMTVGWWLMRTPAFNIGRIVVDGELVHNTALTLRANVAPVLKGNFFTVDLKAAQHAFEQAPWIQEARVRREYPNGLRVSLKEHVAEAFWGPETGSGLLNKSGEVFEANLGELDREGLPRLQGPDGSAPRVLQMYHALAPALKPLNVELDSLTLNARGSWDAVLDNDAQLELGGGTTEDVLLRVQRLVRTLPKISSQYQRSVADLASADLRYEDGYALRLKGVTTGSSAPALASPRR
ncbi:cell division protein FtsQ/DivIB [Comamonas sp. Y33R10-2]|uniref:cell division protein FtsQ/DivIB n=1 Tax=Comamonas sp. Y33R10-2 TaxID=2853257 RepID=UPI001C5CA12F|nr:cell division protein FtsQ/DivIB [Comamonas sp. Y33R10-2]QXZ09382.1 cell division protein FtsQ/DivIB [Comamonas sp. Y33R10-2]